MEKLSSQIALFQVAEIAVSYQPKFKASERPTVSSSRDVYNFFFHNWDNTRIEMIEQFKIMLLNRANKILGIFTVSTGGVAGTVADPKVIFATALKGNASSIILAHNHPSGNLKPSEADRQLTNKLSQAGKLLDISVLDHLIITADEYFSFADEGLL